MNTGTRNEGEQVRDAAVVENPAMAEIHDVPGLPRVLLVGDSISIAYTLPVRKLLEGKANVHRIPDNGGSTAFTLKRLDSWLAESKWDVIHFNFGLHDAKFLPDSELQQVSRDDYEKNLHKVIDRLRATGAQLIFATTTPVPEELEPPGRRFDNIPERNEIALKVMKESNIPVNDLYSVILPRQAEFQRPKDVHFDDEGSALLGDHVAACIERMLAARQRPSG